MLSLLKILFTVAVVYAAWILFKNRSRIAKVHKAVMAEQAREKAQAAADAAGRTPGTPLAQDLVPCPKCGSYIAQGTRCSCEKV